VCLRTHVLLQTLPYVSAYVVSLHVSTRHSSPQECIKCPTGTYLIVIGSTTASNCQACPTNSMSQEGGSVTTACRCNTGWTGPDVATCSQCTAGKYRVDSFTTWARACGINRDEPCETAQSSFCSNNLNSERGVDGNPNQDIYVNSCIHTSSGGEQWWMVDFGFSLMNISGLTINGRNDCCTEKTAGYNIWIGDDDSDVGTFTNNIAVVQNQPQLLQDASPRIIAFPGPVRGRFFYFQITNTKHLHFCEVAVWSSTCSLCPANSTSIPGSTTKTNCQCDPGFLGPDGGPCIACQPSECFISSCTACDSGKCKLFAGSAACTTCPSFHTSQPASIYAAKCVSIDGYTRLSAGVCAPCTPGTYIQHSLD